MTTAELYTKGARCWLPDVEKVWKAAEVTTDFKGNKLSVESEDGEQLTLDIKSPQDLPPLRNPAILIGENDLTTLSYLNEPEVLYNLQIRFCNYSAIYTYCGIVLVAINPYEELQIYDNDTIMAYRRQNMGELDPHIFAVAEEAFTKVEREEQNQSIIVSGESGAGKTVSAKYAMRYFATVGGSATETQIEKKVLASNPIMEAIGNAKTTRNDNSSRFGKYIELDFNKQFNIMGGNMRTYLLEKSRVVFQAPEERNYHIFYQLCASASLDEFKDLKLLHQDKFHYTNQGQSCIINGVDDAEYLKETRNAFSLLGFSSKDQMMIFQILAGILHLGNVTVVSGNADNDAESCMIPPNDRHIPIVAELLGIDEGQIRTWLCFRKIASLREVITKPMTKKEALLGRDALAKHIYAHLFSWIVTQINKSLAATAKVHKFIGVLDIYGFETFEINSFEQFCINYANEKLQQQFTQHVFKLEQEEYVREKIEWKFIDFLDNQPCIDLIESKMGVLDLLDEECKMPKGNDVTWVQKLYDKCNKSKHFKKPRLSNTAFVVCHFADHVQYECDGFLGKNRDTVMEEQINILKASHYELVADLFMDSDKPALLAPKTVVKVSPAAKGGPASSKQHKQTVGSQFRASLTLLMSTLNSTTPHYVRCIKPNDEKSSFKFEPKRAVQQLRACGVLETIRISAAGFPSRWPYQDFFSRYRVLIKSKDIKRNDMKTTSENILQNIIKDDDKFKFGKTKIFFRAGQVAYLEKLRADRLRSCCIMIQKRVKGWVQRKKYRLVQNCVLGIQTRIRGYRARKHAKFIRETRAAVRIQKLIRGFVQRRKYVAICRSVLAVQRFARGKWARIQYENMRRYRMAVIIQKWIRGWLARRAFKKNVVHIVFLQSCVRRKIARKEFKRLKVEARSVEHIKKLNKGLENKIISMQQKNGELVKEINSLKANVQDTQALVVEINELRGKERVSKEASNKIAQLEEELAVLRQTLEREIGEKVDLINEKDCLESKHRDMEKIYKEENNRLSQELQITMELQQKILKESEESARKKVDDESKMLLDEFNSERGAHQKLLKDYARLEQRFDNLQNELNRVRGEPTHSRNPSNVSTLSIHTDTTETIGDELPDDDIGYGSVHSHDARRSKLDRADWDQISPKDYSPEGDKKGQVTKLEDVSLVLKLQQKLKEVESEKLRLERKLESIEKDDSPKDEAKRAQEQIRLQELEMENAKQKGDLKNLRSAAAKGTDKEEMIAQFDALHDELSRRREESIQLRSILANNSDEKATPRDIYTGDVNINDDGELLMAFESQKKLIKQLECELQSEKNKYSVMERDFRDELNKLRHDNERQQKLISQNLQKTPQAQTEACMQHEITRLTGENLDLRERNDSQFDQIKRLKKQLKIYAKKLKESEVIKRSSVLSPSPGGENLLSIELHKENEMPVVKHKEVEYMGMFEYRKEDEATIIKNLVYDLKPRFAIKLLPGLPAYMLFMCIRHTDYINDDEKVRTLLTHCINGIKRVIKKRHEELDVTVMWLANTCRLLHNLKQYSGDKAFQAENTPKQNEQCLRNFDLSEYRQVLSDIAVWIYQGVIKIMEEKVQELIVPAVLEHEAIAGISGKPSGMRGRSSSVAREVESPVNAKKALDVLMTELTNFYRVMSLHAVDPELLNQVFKQIFYFICAGALNNLLLRKEMCHWTKGMQIRYNLSHLEQWCRDQKLQDTGVTEPLEPVIQASQLLQARKTDEDVQSICDMCGKLTMAQIVKILNLYTPIDEYEDRVPIAFIRKIQAKLAEREEGLLQSTLLMDTKFAYPVRFPFNPSNIRLEDIVIPEGLHLPVLKKV